MFTEVDSHKRLIKEKVEMSEYKNQVLNQQDKALVEEYEGKYVPGVVFVKRSANAFSVSKKVNVYVDGLLVSMSEDTLNHLIEIGFYIVVTRRP
jgi:hypothetical protein